jgi:hypothetical protein
VCKVGVFVDAPRADVVAIARLLALDALQFHGAESAEYCAAWDRKVIKAVRVRDSVTLAAAGEACRSASSADAWVAAGRGPAPAGGIGSMARGIGPARLRPRQPPDPTMPTHRQVRRRPSTLSGERSHRAEGSRAHRRFVANTKNA